MQCQYSAVNLQMCLLVNAVDRLEAIFIRSCCSMLRHTPIICYQMLMLRRDLLLVESLSDHCCHEHRACLLYASVVPQYGSFKLLKPCKHSLESRHTQLHTLLCKTSREQCSWWKSQAKIYSECSNSNKCMRDWRAVIHAYLGKVIFSWW